MPFIGNARSTAMLFLGDLLVYLFSLVMTLSIRYGMIPTKGALVAHLPAFSILIVFFLIINLSAGLYDKQLGLLSKRVNTLLVKTQIVNALVGVLFFYFAPVLIAPKANLFIYFAVSTAILYLWRLIMFPVLASQRKQSAILIGSGTDIDDLRDEINSNMRYGILFKEVIAPTGTVSQMVEAITKAIKEKGVSIIVADLHNKVIEDAMPSLYSMIFSGIQIIDASKLYESVFDQIPVSLVGERWLVENSAASLGNRRFYDREKRLMDIAVSVVLGAVSLIAYPFVWAAIKLDDHGPIFIKQDRMGKGGKLVRIIKFRSMSGDDSGKYGTDGKTANVITKVGKFLRNSRIDELPQLWNVLKGDLSLIGPRPELPSLVQIYEKEIPYYNVRHLVKPGLSGWAQIYHENHPHHAVDITEARNKLYYDLYYIKNRSFALDLRIALRTLQILLQRAGR